MRQRIIGHPRLARLARPALGTNREPPTSTAWFKLTTRLLKLQQCVLMFVLLMLTLPMFIPTTARTHAATIQQPMLLDGGDVLTFSISPNSRYVVYQAVGGKIYSVALAGGAPVELTTTPVSTGGYFLISPDSTRVVFAGNDPGASTETLVSVPLTGGSPTPLASGAISLYRISPDSKRVVYDINQGFSDSSPRDIYSVPITSSAAIQLNQPLTGAQRVENEQISTDSQQVVYELSAGRFSTDPPHILYRVPIAGGSPIQIDDAFAADKGAQYLLSPDSAYVVYTRTLPSTDPATLQAAPLAGGPSVQLDTPAGFSGQQSSLTITADSRRAIFSLVTPYDFYSTLLNGTGTAIKLGPSNISSVMNTALTPDGQRFVYDNSDGTNYYVSSIPVDGGSTTIFSSTLVPLSLFAISPDSQRVVYVAGGDELYSEQLFSAPLAGGTAPIRLSDPLAFPSSFAERDLIFTPDSSTLIYRVKKTTASNSSYDLFSTPIDKNEPGVKLNGSLATVAGTAAESLSFRVSPDGKYVIFRAGSDPDIFASRQLYAVALNEIGFQVFVPLLQR